MKIKAIVYTSESGHTKEYAGILSVSKGIKGYELKNAKKELAEKS